MRDKKEGIKKAVSTYEDNVKLKGGEELENWHLSEDDKDLIEYGYIQCMIQVGYNIGTEGKSFIVGLQEMILSGSNLDNAKFVVESIGKKVNVTKAKEDTKIGNTIFKAGTKVYQCPSCSTWVTPTMKYCSKCSEKLDF